MEPRRFQIRAPMNPSASPTSHSAVPRDVVSLDSSPNEASASGVSWSAVFAGSAVTAALGLILLALGTGLGLSSVSVWSNVGISANAIGAAAIAWLIAIEVISSAMGGYLA